jgi:hypothetical protein
MADIIGLLNNRINTRAFAGPRDAYSREIDRHAREGEGFERNPQAEDLILKSWDLATLYAKNVLKGRWSEFEDVMIAAGPSTELTQIQAVLKYAEGVAMGPVAGVEKHIANNAVIAADYSMRVMKEPWVSDVSSADDISISAHNAILRSPQASMHYDFDRSRSQKTFGP